MNTNCRHQDISEIWKVAHMWICGIWDKTTKGGTDIGAESCDNPTSNIFEKTVPSSVRLVFRQKRDTISWLWRLQRPPIRNFGFKNKTLFQYHLPHIFVLFLYPQLVFFLASWNINHLKSFSMYFSFKHELEILPNALKNWKNYSKTRIKMGP